MVVQSIYKRRCGVRRRRVGGGGEGSGQRQRYEAHVAPQDARNKAVR